MATNNYISLRETSERQEIAINALLEGATHAVAAERAGVHRVTVSNWAARHPAFRAELNRRRNERAEERFARLRELDERALEAAASRLEAADPEFAMKWLKFRGPNATVLSATGPTSPDAVIDELVAERAERAQRDEFDRLLAPGPNRDRLRIDLEIELEEEFDIADDQ
jgi:hypothetical protein